MLRPAATRTLHYATCFAGKQYPGCFGAGEIYFEGCLKYFKLHAKLFWHLSPPSLFYGSVSDKEIMTRFTDWCVDDTNVPVVITKVLAETIGEDA